MTVKTRQSGQPARVMLRRNKPGSPAPAVAGSPVRLPEPSGAPPLFVRLEGQVKRLEARVLELERLTKESNHGKR